MFSQSFPFVDVNYTAILINYYKNKFLILNTGFSEYLSADACFDLRYDNDFCLTNNINVMIFSVEIIKLFFKKYRVYISIYSQEE